MLDYELTPRAVRDMSAAMDWYQVERQDLAHQFFDSVLIAIRRARETPTLFAEVEPAVRAVGCRRFPYRVYFETLPNLIVVRAVYHSARDPDRWADEDRD